MGSIREGFNKIWSSHYSTRLPIVQPAHLARRPQGLKKSSAMVFRLRAGRARFRCQEDSHVSDLLLHALEELLQPRLREIPVGVFIPLQGSEVSLDRPRLRRSGRRFRGRRGGCWQVLPSSFATRRARARGLGPQRRAYAGALAPSALLAHHWACRLHEPCGHHGGCRVRLKRPSL